MRKPRAIQLGRQPTHPASLPSTKSKKKNTFPSRKLKKTVAVAITYPPQHNILSSGTSFIAVVCENVSKKLIFFFGFVDHLIYLKNIFTTIAAMQTSSSSVGGGGPIHGPTKPYIYPPIPPPRCKRQKFVSPTTTTLTSLPITQETRCPPCPC